LRIVTPRGLSDPEEISADALSVRGFEQYRCDDYHLGRTVCIIDNEIHLMNVQTDGDERTDRWCENEL